MALLQKKLTLISFLILCMILVVSSRGPVYTPPNVERLTDRFDRVSVNQSYNVVFGGANIHMKNNGTTADLILDKSSGSGLVSKNKLYHGFFNAALKLPAGFTSGVVVAFYLSNGDDFPKNHDEIDFELLGHDKRRDWVLQTNIYGNGSVKTGREEKFYLWFDPTQAFHDYTILWNNHHILFLVDNVPIRQVIKNNAIYPSKPMSAYLTIWDGSEWATHGGKYGVNYNHAPFIVSMTGVQIQGCIQQQKQQEDTITDIVPTISCNSKSDPSTLDPINGDVFSKLSPQQEKGLDWARGKHMFYSYCKDTSRYKVLPLECNAS